MLIGLLELVCECQCVCVRMSVSCEYWKSCQERKLRIKLQCDIWCQNCTVYHVKWYRLMLIFSILNDWHWTLHCIFHSILQSIPIEFISTLFLFYELKNWIFLNSVYGKRIELAISCVTTTGLDGAIINFVSKEACQNDVQHSFYGNQWLNDSPSLRSNHIFTAST